MKLENAKISPQEKLNLFINLGTMLKAGIPIIDVVDSLLEDTKGSQKIILQTLKDDLTTGKTVSSSFARFPKTFDTVTINVLRAAEQSGTLDSSLHDVQINIQKEMEFNDKVRSAMLYPVIIFGVFILVILTILLFVMPRISTVFSSLHLVIPLPTKILIWTSNLLIHQSIYVLGVLILVFISGFVVYVKKKKWLFNLFLALPGVAKMAREIDLTRFARSLSLLLGVGIPIVAAIELAENTVVKSDLAKAIKKAREMVTAGKKLSDGLKASKKLFPKIMLKVIEAGEQSGTLGESLQYISSHLDYLVTNSLKTFTVLIEPVMLVVIGVVVGGIMLSIVGPIYSLIGQISPR